MLDKTSSIICAFGLASAAPRSPYRHLELCGIAHKRLENKYDDQNQTRCSGCRNLGNRAGTHAGRKRL
ncbi:MAG: hypothetical protein WA039_04265 [Gemmiger qucibialis]